jgi:hypothetical protein
VIFVALVLLFPLAWWIKRREDRRNAFEQPDEIRRPRPTTDATKPPTWGPGSN